MAQHQGAMTRLELPSRIPVEIMAAATRYQRLRGEESERLAVMARHNLLDEWTPDIRVTVLSARETVREARAARAGFRDEVRALVSSMRERGEALPAVLRLTRSMIRLLEHDGALLADDGWIEAEVLQWVIEDYEIIS